MAMNNRILRPLARPLLLDAVPGAAAAYSLRQLSNAYTGPVVTVRRSSDSAEADFKASEIDDGTLAAFCGAGDGFVKTWFDQSGNTGRDASQGTAGYQPKIVSSGSLVTEGGKPALEFDGSDDFFSASFGWAANAFSIFAIAARTSTSVYPAIIAEALGATSGYLALGYNIVSGANLGEIAIHRVGLATAKSNLVPGDGVLRILSYISDGIIAGSVSVSVAMDAVNAAAPLTLSSLSSTSTTNVGASKSGFADRLDGTISEVIIYPSDQSANRQRIEGDIAWYY